MSDTRSDFTRILEEKFQDAKLKKLCQDTSKNCLENKDVSRAFDHLPDFLPEAVLVDDCRKFENMLLQIKSVDKDYQLVEKKNKTQITAYIKSLTELACKELLDKKGQVKKDIITLLDWEKYKEVIPAQNIVCAFIAGVNMSIAKRLADFIDKHEVAYQAYATYVNRNCLRWAKETLRDKGFSFGGGLDEKEGTSHVLEIIRLPTKKQAAVLGGVLAGVAAVAWIGLTLFGAMANRDSKGASAGVGVRPGKP